MQSAKDWPSMTLSVLHLHGTATDPEVEVLWIGKRTVPCECCSKAIGEYRSSVDCVLCDDCVRMLTEMVRERITS